MDCRKCSSSNPDKNRFCGNCGTVLPEQCKLCGFEISSDARFCGGCGSSLTETAESAPENNTQYTQSAAERRFLTVMFCDLVGSTDLSTRLDPEDMSKIISEYQACCIAAIKANHGYIARFMGDGILAYYGYPRATEFHAESAIRSGLEIIDAIGSVDTGYNIELQTRVGIASGLVVVGNVVADGANSREEVVVGETPNLAARLQGIAKPNKIAVSSHSKRLVGRLFDFNDLGDHEVKGFEKPVPVFEVLRESMVESRFSATRKTDSMTSLVGRGVELDTLDSCWRKAQSGSKQLVLISGEAGIGKSRLIAEFSNTIDSNSAIVIRINASPHAMATAYFSVVEYYKRQIGIQIQDTDPVQLKKLSDWLDSNGHDGNPHVSLFASLLGIDDPDSVQMSPPEKKFHTLTMLIGDIKKQASRQPVVLLIEDLHWLDASTIELIEQLFNEPDATPLLAIATFRPEFEAPWRDESYLNYIHLNRLSPDNISEFIKEICNGKSLPAEINEHIVNKADGIALHAEELTKSLIEGPLLTDTGQEFVLNDRFLPGSMPDTLQESFMARLDRLAPIKDIAQLAATLGREFRLDILTAISDKPAEVVIDALHQLQLARIIRKQGSGAETTYIYQHALMQDAAYEAMLKSTRRALHAKIARLLQNDFPELVEDHAELLAHHCTEAGLYDEGLRHWLKASKEALRSFAHKEVCQNLDRGIDLLPHLTDTDENRSLVFEMLGMKGSAKMVISGPGHNEVGKAYQSAYDFAHKNPDLEGAFPVEFGLCRFHWAAGRIHQATDMALTMKNQLVPDAGEDQVMGVHLLLGLGYYHQGEMAKAASSLEKVTKTYRVERDAQLFFTYMKDFYVFGSFYHALSLAALNDYRSSREVARHALEHAKELNNPHEIGFGLLANFITALLDGEYAESVNYADYCIKLSTEHGFPEFVALAQVCKASALIKLGETGGQLNLIELNIEKWSKTGFKAWVPWMRGLLAEACVLTGSESRAYQELEKATSIMNEQSEWQAKPLLDKVAKKLETAAVV